MKKISKILSTMVLSAALSLGVAGAAFADVVYQNRDVAVTGAGQYTETDLFDRFKDVMPGDKLDQPVTITNNSSLDVNVYLRVEAHDEESNSLTYSEPYEETDGKDQGQNPDEGDLIGGEGQRDETVATMTGFLAQLTMVIENGDAVIFSSSPDQEAQLAENVLLGGLAPGETMQLDVELLVPTALGNEYANRVGEVDWVFTVEEIDDTGLSQTGDNSPTLLLVGAVAIAGIVIAIAARVMRRKA